MDRRRNGIGEIYLGRVARGSFTPTPLDLLIQLKKNKIDIYIVHGHDAATQESNKEKKV